MKRIFSVAVFMAMVLGVSARAETKAGDDGDRLIAAKAQALTKDKPSRLAKLSALQTFVRDEIAQSKTQYG